MAGTLGAVSHLVHFLGFSMAIGGSLAALKAHGAAKNHESGAKAGIEDVAASILVAVELPGLFIALFGGILAIVDNPNHLKPAMSGAGPWLHIKLTLVLAVLVIAHLRMFRSKRLVRERSSGANESDCNALLDKALMFGKIDVALTMTVVLLATFRYVFFA